MSASEDETASQPEVSLEDQGMSIIDHLIELRDRLLKGLLAVAIVFGCLFPFSDVIYSTIATPLLAHMPEGTSMIAIDVASPFLVPFKLTLMVSIVVAVPVLLYQAWQFVAPGLYKHEKSLVAPLLISSVLLFYLGMAFAYYVVLPLVFNFLLNVAPSGIAVATDIGRYLDFITTLFFAFGIAFEVPIATILLVITGATTPEQLAAKRAYVIVAVFVIGMLLTPPDVISQTLLAIPMWLLYEIGILCSKLLVRKQHAKTMAS